MTCISGRRCSWLANYFQMRPKIQKCKIERSLSKSPMQFKAVKTLTWLLLMFFGPDLRGISTSEVPKILRSTDFCFVEISTFWWKTWDACIYLWEFKRIKSTTIIGLFLTLMLALSWDIFPVMVEVDYGRGLWGSLELITYKLFFVRDTRRW